VPLPAIGMGPRGCSSDDIFTYYSANCIPKGHGVGRRRLTIIARGYTHPRCVLFKMLIQKAFQEKSAHECENKDVDIECFQRVAPGVVID